MLRWDVGHLVAARTSGQVWRLLLENRESETMEAHIQIELTGLRIRRIVDLGTHVVAALSTATRSWDAATSPIAPTGTSAFVDATASFSRGGVTVPSHAQPVSLAFSSDRSLSYLAERNDVEVRLVSLGLRAVGAPSTPLTASERTALLSRLGSRVGKLDAVPGTSSRTTMTDLIAIRSTQSVRLAFGWETFRVRAESHLMSGSPKYIRLRDMGALHGVVF